MLPATKSLSVKGMSCWNVWWSVVGAVTEGGVEWTAANGQVTAEHDAQARTNLNTMTRLPHTPSGDQLAKVPIRDDPDFIKARGTLHNGPVR